MSEYFVKFTLEHAIYIAQNNVQARQAFVDMPGLDLWWNNNKDNFLAYTLMDEDIPIACGGLTLQVRNMAEAWLLMSTSARKHIIQIYRAVKVGLTAMIYEQKLVRVQATVDASWKEAQAFVESLGFECEGRLRRFGPNQEDYYVYSRIK